MIQSDNSETKASVIIIGAGPVGLLLANLLGSYGVPTTVFEKGSSLGRQSMAIGITPPSLQILNRLGLDKEFIRCGIRISNAHIHGSKRVIGNLSFSGIRSVYPFILSLPQYQSMAILRNNMKKFQCVSVCYGMEFIEKKESDESVRVKIKNLNKNVCAYYHSSYLVGCDGSNSQVRKVSGIKTVFSKYKPRFVMADFTDNTRLGTDAHLFFTHLGAVESFPLPDNRRRWILQHENNDQIDCHKLIQQVKRRTRFELCHSDATNLSSFQPQKIDVEKYFKGLTLICGDACRVMSPIGGQGMNTGFADANVLSCVLKDVILGNGKIKPSFEFYSRTRRIASGRATKKS